MDSSYKNGINLLQTLVTTTNNVNDVVTKTTNSEQVTLASAAFGRGSDFICHYEEGSIMEKNGGMEVIQTFLSESITEEIQIKGRTARQGQEGSYKMVLCSPDLLKFGISTDEIKQQLKSSKFYEFLNGARSKYYQKVSEARKADVVAAQEKDKISNAFLDDLANYKQSNQSDLLGKCTALQ